MHIYWASVLIVDAFMRFQRLLNRGTSICDIDWSSRAYRVPRKLSSLAARRARRNFIKPESIWPGSLCDASGNVGNDRSAERFDDLCFTVFGGDDLRRRAT